MKLGMWKQLPEFLPMEARESISDLISNARHILSRKGQAIISMTKAGNGTAILF